MKSFKCINVRVSSEDLEKEKEKIDPQERAILYSNNLLKAFDGKANEFNELHEQKVTPSQIKSVYLNAVSLRLNPDVKNLYAFARINLFFDMLTGKEAFLTGVYPQSEPLEEKTVGLVFELVDVRNISRGKEIEKPIDFFEQYSMVENHFSQAREDLVKYDVDFVLSSADDELFLTKNKKCNYLWEIL